MEFKIERANETDAAVMADIIERVWKVSMISSGLWRMT